MWHVFVYVETNIYIHNTHVSSITMYSHSDLYCNDQCEYVYVYSKCAPFCCLLYNFDITGKSRKTFYLVKKVLHTNFEQEIRIPAHSIIIMHATINKPIVLVFIVVACVSFVRRHHFFSECGLVFVCVCMFQLALPRQTIFIIILFDFLFYFYEHFSIRCAYI